MFSPEYSGDPIETKTRLRVGRAIGKSEEEIAPELMRQVIPIRVQRDKSLTRYNKVRLPRWNLYHGTQIGIKRYAPDGGPPALATDGKGAYREAMLETWGKVPEYGGRGAPPKLPKPGKDWQYLQVIKKRKGGKLESVRIKVIYGDEDKVERELGCHTAYVERTNLTSRQMNGRLVRKTLSFSKELRLLEAASALEDALYNFTRPVKTLRVELVHPTKQARWQQRTPAMAAGLTDHVWTTGELLTTILVPQSIYT